MPLPKAFPASIPPAASNGRARANGQPRCGCCGKSVTIKKTPASSVWVRGEKKTATIDELVWHCECLERRAMVYCFYCSRCLPCCRCDTPLAVLL